MDDGRDWETNGLQAIGLKSPQYEQALRNARRIAEFDPNVVFVGHSLGGGLASLQALATGRQALTYNAVGLSTDTLNRYTINPFNAERLTQAYYIQGEVLSTLQDIPGALPGMESAASAVGDLPSALGTRFPLQAPAYSGMDWTVEMHGMTNVAASFADRLEALDFALPSLPSYLPKWASPSEHAWLRQQFHLGGF